MTSKAQMERKAAKAMEDAAGPEPIGAPLIAPQDAAVNLRERFRSLARTLRPGDESTQDDLVQEASLAVLQCKTWHTESYYLQLGVSRALNYLRWWDDPRTGPLEESEEKEPAAKGPKQRPDLERCRAVLPAA